MKCLYPLPANVSSSPGNMLSVAIRYKEKTCAVHRLISTDIDRKRFSTQLHDRSNNRLQDIIRNTVRRVLHRLLQREDQAGNRYSGEKIPYLIEGALQSTCKVSTTLLHAREWTINMPWDDVTSTGLQTREPCILQSYSALGKIQSGIKFVGLREKKPCFWARGRHGWRYQCMS